MRTFILLALVLAIAVSYGEAQADDCVDSNPTNCPNWAAEGRCKTSKFMLKNCKRSCNVCDSACTDSDEDCGAFAARGDCERTPDWMLKNCKKACGACT